MTAAPIVSSIRRFSLGLTLLSMTSSVQALTPDERPGQYLAALAGVGSSTDGGNATRVEISWGLPVSRQAFVEALAASYGSKPVFGAGLMLQQRGDAYSPYLRAGVMAGSEDSVRGAAQVAVGVAMHPAAFGRNWRVRIEAALGNLFASESTGRSSDTDVSVRVGVQYQLARYRTLAPAPLLAPPPPVPPVPPVLVPLAADSNSAP
jgi:hypothetical protein